LAVVVIVVRMASAPDLSLFLLDFAVLILPALMSPIHTELNIIFHAISRTHQIGGCLRFDLDKVSQFTHASGCLTAL